MKEFRTNLGGLYGISPAMQRFFESLEVVSASSSNIIISSNSSKEAKLASKYVCDYCLNNTIFKKFSSCKNIEQFKLSISYSDIVVVFLDEDIGYLEKILFHMEKALHDPDYKSRSRLVIVPKNRGILETLILSRVSYCESVILEIPKIQDRIEDIPLVLYSVINKNDHRYFLPKKISSNVMQIFQDHSWKNMDEVFLLGKMIRDYIDSKKTVLELSEIPEEMIDKFNFIMPECKDVDFEAEETSLSNLDLNEIPLSSFPKLVVFKNICEKEYYKALLDRTNGNMSLAAQICGQGRPYLYKKVKENKIDPNDFREKQLYVN